MRGLWAPLALVAARLRRRPGRWLLAALGVALAAAFAGAVATEGTIAADQSARSVLSGLSPAARTVRVSWQGVVTGSVRRQARGMLSGLDLDDQTEVVLLNPVRLDGTLVRPAAIGSLTRWLSPGSPRAPGPCHPNSCPMLISGRVPRRTLTSDGVKLSIVGSTQLRSAVPLGFSAAAGANQQPPVLLTADVAGLDALSGLGGIYRSHSWLAQLPTSGLHAWELGAVRDRMQKAQARLLSSASNFTLSAPFDAIDQARTEANAAPRRLLLAGGGALAAFALFIVLAASAFRSDQRADYERLRIAGARHWQCAVFVIAESGSVCGIAVIVGACVAVLAAVVLAHAAGVPAGGVLTHSLLTTPALLGLVTGWVAATALLSLAMVGAGGRAADLAAVAAAAALTVALSVGPGSGDQFSVLLAPLCCVVAGVVIYRVVAAVLRGGERFARRGPVLARLAFVGLARAPASPSLAVAFVAVSVGLGGFALAYRATLLRGTADQAANVVPLDATVSPGADFVTPLRLASLDRWRSLSRGVALPVRDTEATYASGGGTVTVPALGVPAAGLPLIHGWRSRDGSAPLGTLASRLAAHGPTRMPGPSVVPGAHSLTLRVVSPGLGVAVTADLRSPSGTLTQVSLGSAGAGTSELHSRLPKGSWELQAIELDEPAGLEITTGHQNAEASSAATQTVVTVGLGPVRMTSANGQTLARVDLGGWRGVGAATVRPGAGHSLGSGSAVVRFTESGRPGLMRPPQPSDTHPVPVLVDGHTASSAAPGGRLALTVDGQPVNARVVGVLRRFPTAPASAAGFVVADEAVLAGALDAQMPAQGAADDLWISSRHLEPLRAALQTAPLSRLNRSFRADVERGLRVAPIARGVLGTLVAAAALAMALAALGLLVTLLGPARDKRVQQDLLVQGVSPSGLRRELRLRLLIASVLGTVVGLGVAVLLTRLAVASVRAVGTVAVPRPGLVTVAPWGELAAWGLVAIAALAVTSWVASR